MQDRKRVRELEKANEGLRKELECLKQSVSELREREYVQGKASD